MLNYNFSFIFRENRLSVFQICVLREIFGANRVEVNIPQPTPVSLQSGSVYLT